MPGNQSLPLPAPFITLLWKDLRTEWRQKHALAGVGLYVGSTVFLIYAMGGRPAPQTWNLLFWIAQLFAAANTVARSFLGEPPARFRYYYTLVRPGTFFLAKSVYAVLLQAVVSALSVVLFSVLLGAPAGGMGRFGIAVAAGTLSLATVFTFLSALSARAGGNAALMAVLGFPLLTPVLMMLSRLALGALTPVVQPGWWGQAASLLGFSGLVLVLGLVLFPYLWKE